ncbi:MAG: hypothetical protein K0M67_01565 [Thiobacillus sp.]|nr:hypothetical protein [Thiobacillus sp.]
MFATTEKWDSKMSFTVSAELVSATESQALKSYRDIASDIRVDRDLEIDTTSLELDGLQDIIQAAAAVGGIKAARAAESVMLARNGRFDKPVPNFKAFKGFRRCAMFRVIRMKTTGVEAEPVQPVEVLA